MYQNLISKFNNKVWRHIKKSFLKKRKMLVLSNFMCHNTLHKGHNMVHKFIYSQTQDSLCCHADYSQQEMHYLLLRLRDWVTNFSYHELFTWPTFKKRKRKKKRPTAIEFPGKEPAKHKNNQSKTYLIDPKQNCTLKLLKISNYIMVKYEFITLAKMNPFFRT